MCYNVFVLADVSRKLRFNDVASVAIHNRITMCPKRAMSFYFRRLLGQLEPNGIALLAFQGVEHMKEIRLSNGMVALVDDEDYEELGKHKWQAHKNRHVWYAVREKVTGVNPRTREVIQMHRAIMNAPDGVEVDHRDGDGLFNCKSNLRLCSKLQNQYNRQKRTTGSSQFKGVWFDPKRKKWQAKIKTGIFQRHLGYFEFETDAARAYDEAARKYFGEFARPNFSE